MNQDLLTALKMALDWIDAVPKDTPLPAMPGFDRDFVDGVIARAEPPAVRITKDGVQIHGGLRGTLEKLTLNRNAFVLTYPALGEGPQLPVPLTPGRYRTRNGQDAMVYTIQNDIALGAVDNRHAVRWNSNTGLTTTGESLWDIVARAEGGQYPCMDTTCTGTMRHVYECDRCGLQHPGGTTSETIVWHPATEQPVIPEGKDYAFVLFIGEEGAQSGSFDLDEKFYCDEGIACYDIRWWAYLPTGPVE